VPTKTRAKRDRTSELLEQLLIIQLHALGASQDRMAKAIGRSKSWVNDQVKGLRKGRRSDGGQTQGKKAKS
jgi:transposase